jgi:hypothetical protein
VTPTRRHSPPPWLDPQWLGAKRLRRVGHDRLRAISGGASELLDYFLLEKDLQASDLQAYVLIRNLGDAFAFSKEQFGRDETEPLRPGVRAESRAHRIRVPRERGCE